MSLNFNVHELTDLMKNFYTLTGIRIVLFDESYNEISAYPKECSPFCFHLRQNPEFYKLCCQSDRVSFEQCKKSGKLTMYTCHAGLIEATSPILYQGSIVGYIMFGQVCDNKEKKYSLESLSEIAIKYNCHDKAEELIKKVKFKSENQLVAASKILEACTSYILFKEIVKPSRIKLFRAIDEYITSHLNENITVPILCKEFNISRTRLYALCNQYISGGIASYVKTKRLLKAKELLETTDITVKDVSLKVGFSDYNYFLKAFKKHFGISTKLLRKKS